MNEQQTWKIGELAKQLGISPRALRHYENVGLISPPAKGKNGYREYGKKELQALQMILSLKALGMSLEAIKQAMRQRDFKPLEVMRQTVALNESRIGMLEQMNSSLKGIMARNADVSAEEFIFLIRMSQMVNKHYTPAEMEYFAKRSVEVGEKRIREVENAWPELIAKVRAEMEKGTDPKSPVVKKLAKQWQGLVAEFTGGDPKIAARTRELYEKHQGAMPAHPGMPTPEMMAFIGKAQ